MTAPKKRMTAVQLAAAKKGRNTTTQLILGALTRENKHPDDVVWIGSLDGNPRMSWADFMASDVSKEGPEDSEEPGEGHYDDEEPFPREYWLVPENLAVVGDGWWLEVLHCEGDHCGRMQFLLMEPPEWDSSDSAGPIKVLQGSRTGVDGSEVGRLDSIEDRNTPKAVKADEEYAQYLRLKEKFGNGL